jgi:hypothetical protein
LTLHALQSFAAFQNVSCKSGKVDQGKAEELMAAVEKIHNMFWTSKGRSDSWTTAS